MCVRKPECEALETKEGVIDRGKCCQQVKEEENSEMTTAFSPVDVTRNLDKNSLVWQFKNNRCFIFRFCFSYDSLTKYLYFSCHCPLPHIQTDALEQPQHV